MHDDHVAQSLMHLAVAEREDFLDLLTSLREEQWDADSLCEGWTVRDVVAHVLSFEDLTKLQAIKLVIGARIRRVPANTAAMDPYRRSTAIELTRRMRSHLTPTGLTAGFKGGIALADGMIHQQDIRRPLGIARHIPADRVTAALQIALKAPTLPSRRRMHGLRLVATDTPWTHGQGAELCGPAEALLMLTAGRETAAAECSGRGIERWVQSH